MAGTNPISALLVVLITILVPPVGVYLIAGCGADLIINICLTVLGYFPGHIHAFYLEYVYFDRRSETMGGGQGRAQGGRTQYGTVDG